MKRIVIYSPASRREILTTLLDAAGDTPDDKITVVLVGTSSDADIKDIAIKQGWKVEDTSFHQNGADC